MQQINIWSPYHQTGTTSISIILSTYIAINYNLRCLIAHNQYSRSNLECAFIDGSKENEDFITLEGIDALEIAAKSNKLTKEEIWNSTRLLIKNRLELLYGSKKQREELNETIFYILACAKQAYDLTFIDVSSGINNKVTDMAMRTADLIVVNLNQNLKVLDDFFTRKIYHNELDSRKYIIVLNNYDTRSKYTTKYIKKLYNFKDDIFAIPKCVDYMDSHNDHKVLDFMISNNDTCSSEEDYNFLNQIKNISLKVLDLCEIDSQAIESPINNKNNNINFFRFFKGEK